MTTRSWGTRTAALRREFAPVVEAYLAILRREAPDVVLVSGTYFLPWCLLLAARRYGRAKIFVHYHGVLSEEVAHWTSARDRGLMEAMERDFQGEEITYVFPSALARDVVRERVFPVADERSIVLPNPVPDHFFRTRAAARRSGRRFAAVSRWSPVKNPEFLARFGRFLDSDGEGCRISIVTDHSVVASGEFADSIDFLPPRATGAMPRFFRGVDVVLSPSRFETYGNVAQEAVACGTPALVGERMGVAETFREIGLGHLVVPFASSRGVFEASREAASRGVSRASIVALRERCGAALVYGRYAEILRGRS